MLNCLQRLYLVLRFDASPADSFSSCKAPVETFTNPYKNTSTVSISLISKISTRNFSNPQTQLQLLLRLPPLILFGNVLTLVIELLSSRQTDLDLGPAVPEIYLQGYQRISLSALLPMSFRICCLCSSSFLGRRGSLLKIFPFS